MKKKELRNLSEADMKKNLLELEKGLLKDRSKIAMKTPPVNPGKVRQVRKTIARLHTFLHQKSKKEV